MHALFCYMVVTAQTTNSDTFVFDELADVLSARSKINKLFPEFYANSPNARLITQGLTARVHAH